MKEKLSPTLYGFLLSALAHGVFTAFDTVSKITIARLSVYQVLAIELLVALLVMLGYFIRIHGKNIGAELKVNNWKIVGTVGFLRVAGQLLAFIAIAHVSLAHFYVALFSISLIVALMSSVILKEKVSASLLFSILVCFAGILIALRPSADTNIWLVVVLFSAVLIAAFCVALRKASQSETTAALSIYPFIISLVSMGACAVFDFRPLAIEDAMLCVAGGALYGVAAIIYNTAIRHAPAAYVSAAQYLQLIYGSIAGFMVFGDIPDVWTYVGGAIVIGANIYLMATQRKAK